MSNPGFPITLNGQTFTAADFDGYGYLLAMPQLFNGAATDISSKLTAAQTAQSQASGSATLAQNSADTAGAHATSAAASFASLDARYLGAAGVDPTTDNNGNPLQAGACYFNIVIGRLKVWNAATSAWELGYAISGDYVLKASMLWATKTSAYTAVPGDLIDANTTAGSFAITLPGTGIVVGSPVAVRGRGWETNAITIDPPAGGSIEGPGGSTAVAETCSNSAYVLKFICIDATPGAVKWRVAI